MEKIFCPQCGAEATSDDFSCPRCEALLNAAALEEEPSSVVQALLSGNAPLRRPEHPPAAPAAPAQKVRPATRTVPRVKRGVDLALNPLSSFEAYLVSCIDGFLSIEEIAARAKLSAAELLLIFQGEALRDVIELRVVSRPVAGVAEPVTVVEALPRGAGQPEPKPPPPPPILPQHAPLGVRITAPSTRELRSMSQPARGTSPTAERVRPPAPPPAAAPPPPPPQASRSGPKSSAQLEGDEEQFQAHAALSADGRIVSDRPTKPSSPSPRPGARETVTERAPESSGGEIELAPAAPEEPPLELAREVRPRSTGAAPRHTSSQPSRPNDSRANESVLEIASALESRGDVSGAIQILERAIASSNQPAPLYNRLALALVRRNDIARAVKLLEKAVCADPRNKTYARNLETVSQMRRK